MSSIHHAKGGLSDKDARLLARQIVSDSDEVRVKFGKTNGNNVLHVFVPGSNDLGRTIRFANEWEEHPSNIRAIREKNEKRSEANDSDLKIGTVGSKVKVLG